MARMDWTACGMREAATRQKPAEMQGETMESLAEGVKERLEAMAWMSAWMRSTGASARSQAAMGGICGTRTREEGCAAATEWAR